MKMQRSIRNTISAAALMIGACLAGTHSFAQAPSGVTNSPLAALAAMPPVVDCTSLATADISAAVGAKTHITAAVPVTDAKPAAYCKVTGYVEPAVKFEVRLPISGWTQRFVQTGCGGLCGSLNIHLSNDEGCYPATHGEVALASTDMGHSGGNDGKWGEKDDQLRIDFAYRGVHVTTLAAKALIVAYYGKPAKYSYFTGCSDGGREALMEAERYPKDFDGITAGAPAMNFVAQNTFYHGWNVVTNTDSDGKPILTTAKLPILHKVAMDQCDAADGLKDGLISDPISCHVDPSAAQCKPGQDEATCLTAAEVRVARDIYAGAHDSAGHKLVINGPLPGSELAWAGVYIPAKAGDHTMSAEISTGTLKYLAYTDNPPADFTLADLKFTTDNFTATMKLHGLYDATDPDLSSYANGGGKIIIYHGLADQHISPLNTIAYYTAMNKMMGEARVKQFSRLYLFPGGYHCGGGEGPFNVDLLSAIMSWVERGTAPNELIAFHTTGGPAGPGGGGQRGPATPIKVDRTRPVYPYPQTAMYSGSGSIDEAANFKPGPAKLAPADRLQWLGSSNYSPNYEMWCTGDGPSMKCNSKP